MIEVPRIEPCEVHIDLDPSCSQCSHYMLYLIEKLRLDIKQFSRENQLRMLQEECSELAAAINHFIRNKITVRELCSEIADVEILIEQIKLALFVLGTVDEEKALKLARLQAMLDAHENLFNEKRVDPILER